MSYADDAQAVIIDIEEAGEGLRATLKVRASSSTFSTPGDVPVCDIGQTRFDVEGGRQEMRRTLLIPGASVTALGVSHLSTVDRLEVSGVELALSADFIRTTAPSGLPILYEVGVSG